MDLLKNKLFKILFVTTIVGFVFGQFARVQLGNGVAITLLDLSVGLLVASWLFITILKKRRHKDPLLLPMFLFFGGGVISLFVNSNNLQSNQLIVSFLYGLRWLGYAALYFVVKDFQKDFKNKIKSLLFISGSAIVLLGFIQYFFYNNLRNLYYLEWDDHLYRLFSTFLDPNFASVFFALFFISIFGKLQEKFWKKETHTVILYGAVSLLTLLVLVLTYSRTGLITLIVGFVAYVWFHGHKKLLIPFIVLLIFLLVIFSNVGVEGRNPFRSASSGERIKSMQVAFSIIQRNPVFGVGFNAYRYAQHRYGFRLSQQWETSHADAGTDNSWLFVLATTGIVGFLAYGFLWIRVFRVVREVGDVGKRAMVMATLAGFLASSLFLNTLFYPMLMYWMWVLLGSLRENR